MHKHFDPVSLRLFIAVCEERNIARAAEREAIVASAVSKRIAALEDQAGSALLSRGRRGAEPTAAGLALLRQARSVLGAMERMHAELSDFRSGVQGSVRVAASPSVFSERLPEDIARFLSRYPQVRVSVDERVSPDIVRAVREGAAELGVLWDAADLQGLKAVPYRQDRLYVALPAKHPLAQRKQLRFMQALEHLSVGIAPGGLMDTLLRRQAALAGQMLTHRITVSNIDAGYRIVAAGLGAAVLPRNILHGAAPAKVAFVRLKETWALRRFVVVSRKDELLTATARLLVDFLRQSARR